MLNPEESYNVLVAQVHAPVFFSKLASTWGVSPQTPEEAKELLMMAGQLRNAHEQENVKVAQANGSFLAQARQSLNSTLTENGYQSLVDEDATIKKAAAEAVQNPLIKEAALVFNTYLQSLQAR